jgi:serine/threonine protein phosphatase 1
MGDYVDRGSGTPEVVRTLIEFAARRPNTIFLRGNHEQMMLDARYCFDPSWRGRLIEPVPIENAIVWFGQGGSATLESYGAGPAGENPRWWERIPEQHWAFLEDTQMEFVQGRFHFVHAGLVPPGKKWKPEMPGLDPRLWIRSTFLKYKRDFGGRTVVFGHTPQLSGKPLVQRNKIGIDTAAAYGGPLTAAVLSQERGLVAILQA